MGFIQYLFGLDHLTKVIFFDDVPIGDVSLWIKQIEEDPHHGRYDGEEDLRFEFLDHQNSIPLQGRIAIS